MKDLKERFKSRIDYIPTLPVIFKKIIQTLNDPKSSAKDLKNIIINDIAISAKIINLSNSAYFGFNRRITEITNAIVVIGFETIKNIVLSISVMETFRDMKGSKKFDRTQYWYNSIGTAQTTVKIGGILRMANKESLYVAGLLLNIGKILMDYFFPEEYAEVLAKTSVDAYIAEEQIFGFSHAEAGFWVANKWDFPDVLCHCIRHHHDIKTAPDDFKKIVALVTIADYISREAGFGSPPLKKNIENTQQCKKILGIGNSDVNNLVSDLKENSDAIKIFFKEIS